MKDTNGNAKASITVDKAVEEQFDTS